MKLCVIGTGYVGLVGSAVFADWGNEVVGVDIDKAKIDKIEKGVMPIFEPGLKELVLKNITEKRLSFTTSLAKGMQDAEIVFICVGTPQGDDGRAELSAVWAVAKEIAKHLDSYKVIVTKSTVPVGTNLKVKEIIAANLKKKVAFDVASNPEFLREGYSVDDMQSPDRTIVGIENSKAQKVMAKLYAHLTTPVVMTDLASAELIKYASNSFLATKISFINEMANVCELVGGDVQQIAYGMGLDDRISARFLRAGNGYGGSCFPKDVSAMYRFAADSAYDFKILRAVMEVNDRQKFFTINKLVQYFGGSVAGKTLAVLGLAFKENTDDIRHSIAIDTVKQLRGMGAIIKAYDPEALLTGQAALGDVGIKYVKNAYTAAKDADALVLLTEWKEFATLDYSKLKGLLKHKVIIDSKNLLDMAEIEKLGFTYFGTGKQTNGLKKYINIPA